MLVHTSATYTQDLMYVNVQEDFMYVQVDDSIQLELVFVITDCGWVSILQIVH